MRRAAIIATLLFFASASSAETPFQLAVGTNMPNDPDVNGFRLALFYGKNAKMGGVDFGFGWAESQSLNGVAFVMGFHKLSSGMTSSAAFSLVNIHGGKDTGVNMAFINLLGDAGSAFNTGFVTIADETSVDIGGLNKTKRSKAQLGFLNMTDRIDNFQIGFLNMAGNGFFPIFPFVNFPKQ